ncbi:ImmA/IrrE family metallo-endopeptidase [Lacticaseibacillus yichunensis]|uniref:ImmA/IrrE family metallo-endopeptidase n=1 Tax=Lacticaseibacillus yichunensis TaxID=2486015 RepID=A0ABW4CM46_9LACO|nr:ImmA/IrrE family metallo-endopeptidase [Lacticaseibacillus yichunensis]
MRYRYGTADPFALADILDVTVKWSDLGDELLGKTQYILSRPFVLLNNCLRDSEQKYFIMAHELGHVVLHADVAEYYKIARNGDNKAEYEADRFAIHLLTLLYVEENHDLPDTVYELAHSYGVPVLD